VCDYITIVSDASDDAALKNTFNLHGISGYPMQNVSIQMQLRPGERQYRTGSVCDCGTILGRPPSPSTDVELSKIIQRKQKSGWSKAKIDRWLGDRKRAAARPDARADSYDYWANLLRDIASLGSASVSGLIVHAYNGSLDEERFDVMRREVHLSEGLVADVERLRPDELLIVRRQRQHR
jgi:hypothetical protein